jgi:signal transduction histidine kinase
LTVADNGPGIPTAERNRVFERFHRLDESRATTGSGLGLSIVAAIAESYGIAITLADNNPGLSVRLVFESKFTAQAPPATHFRAKARASV